MGRGVEKRIEVVRKKGIKGIAMIVTIFFGRKERDKGKINKASFVEDVLDLINFSVSDVFQVLHVTHYSLSPRRPRPLPLLRLVGRILFIIELSAMQFLPLSLQHLLLVPFFLLLYLFLPLPFVALLFPFPFVIFPFPPVTFPLQLLSLPLLDLPLKLFLFDD